MYYCCFPIYYYTRTTIDTITIDNCYCVLLNYHYYHLAKEVFSFVLFVLSSSRERDHFWVCWKWERKSFADYFESLFKSSRGVDDHLYDVEKEYIYKYQYEWVVREERNGSKKRHFHHQKRRATHRWKKKKRTLDAHGQLGDVHSRLSIEYL